MTFWGGIYYLYGAIIISAWPLTFFNSWYVSDPIPFCNTRKDPKSAWSTNQPTFEDYFVHVSCSDIQR